MVNSFSTKKVLEYEASSSRVAFSRVALEIDNSTASGRFEALLIVPW